MLPRANNLLVFKSNTIYKFSLKLSFSSIGLDKSKLKKQISLVQFSSII